MAVDVEAQRVFGAVDACERLVGQVARILVGARAIEMERAEIPKVDQVIAK
jgi:hypothetical protein